MSPLLEATDQSPLAEAIDWPPLLEAIDWPPLADFSDLACFRTHSTCALTRPGMPISAQTFSFVDAVLSPLASISPLCSTRQ